MFSLVVLRIRKKKFCFKKIANIKRGMKKIFARKTQTLSRQLHFAETMYAILVSTVENVKSCNIRLYISGAVIHLQRNTIFN